MGGTRYLKLLGCCPLLCRRRINESVGMSPVPIYVGRGNIIVGMRSGS